MNRTPHHVQGFTLIELLVVIAIIGVLAALLIPSYTGAQKKPYDAATAQCHRAILVAQNAYKAETGAFTTSLDALGADVQEVCQSQGIRVQGIAEPPSSTTATTNTISIYGGKPTFYTWHPNGTGYIVTSLAEGIRFSKGRW